MPTSTFVFLDTNILFRYVTQGQPGCEAEHWEELKKAVEGRAVTLLVPEVVTLEFEKLVRKLDQKLAGEINRAETAIKSAEEKANLWNELGDLFPFLNDQLSQWKRSKIDDAVSRKKEVDRFLSSEHVALLPFDHDIMFRARRRMLAGRVKVSAARGDADIFIIVTLAKYFEGRGEGYQLLLCTENHKEFGVDVDEKKTLHPLMKEGLPPTELFTDLASLVTAIKSQKQVEEPVPEAVEAAAKREDEKETEEEVNGLINMIIDEIPSLSVSPLQQAIEQAVKIPNFSVSPLHQAIEQAVKIPNIRASLLREAMEQVVKIPNIRASLLREAMEQAVKIPNLSATQLKDLRDEGRTVISTDDIAKAAEGRMEANERGESRENGSGHP
jgi:predicted nucleic acid-binding protein